MLALAALMLASGAQPTPVVDARVREVALRLDRIHIQVNEGRRILWRGSLRVNRMASANYRQSRQQAVAPPCAQLSPSLGEGDELSVELRKWGGNATDPDSYNVVILLQRTRTSDDCRPERQAFTINETTRLDRRQSVELRGEGRLWARLSR